MPAAAAAWDQPGHACVCYCKIDKTNRYNVIMKSFQFALCAEMGNINLCIPLSFTDANGEEGLFMGLYISRK